MNDTPLYTETPASPSRPAAATLAQRINTVAFALFLIMLGALALLPNTLVPEDAWMLGAAVIIVGAQAAHFLTGGHVSRFWLVVAAIALILGGDGLFGVALPFLPVVLIALGLALLLRPLFDRTG